MPVKEASRIFRKRKILTIEEIAHRLERSVVTARRRLKDWGACTSYNNYGFYYTLPSIARYDTYGLWKCGDALFSKYGNLKETFIGVVRGSKAGLNAFEIGEILQLNAHTFLAHFKDNTAIRREKYKGLYFYFSSDVKIWEEQKRQRELLLRNAATLDLPSDLDAVITLVELVKHPKDDIQRLTRRVQKRGVKISIEKIRNLLIYHGIKKNSWAKASKKP